MTVANPVIPGNLAAQLRRSERRKNAFAISLTLPLLVFLLAIFIVPIGALLIRAVENPEVANTLSHTVPRPWTTGTAPQPRPMPPTRP